MTGQVQAQPQSRVFPAEESNPLITVGVACYNIENYIGRCLDSVLAQTYRNLEIIVVDDGSTDQSGSICDAYAARDPRIRVIHQENRGLGGARNTVIRAATGAYLAFVDGDDRIEPAMYETLLSFLREEALDMAICAYRTVGTDGDVAPLQITGNETRKLFDRATLQEYQFLEAADVFLGNAAWNKLYRRELTKGLWFPEHKKFEDVLYTAKLFANTARAGFLDIPFYDYSFDRTGSIMNEGVSEAVVTDLLPACADRAVFLRRIGRSDLVPLHDYHVIMKSLLYYTAARRSRDKGRRRLMPALAANIRTAKGRMREIYACREADPHEALRTRLFLIHPVLYNVFMDLNDFIVLPLRRRLRKR